MRRRFAHPEVLRVYLPDRKLKWTSQRNAILEGFPATEGHLTSEENYRKVGLVHGGMGFSTVYRRLRLFVDAGVPASGILAMA